MSDFKKIKREMKGKAGVKNYYIYCSPVTNVVELGNQVDWSARITSRKSHV